MLVTIEGPADDSITPAIDFVVTVSGTPQKDTIPVGISGVVRTGDMKTLSTIYQKPEEGRTWDLHIHVMGNTYQPDVWKFRCRFELSERSLDHIEKLREGHPMKRARMRFELNVLLLQSYLGWSPLSRREFQMPDRSQQAIYVYDNEGARSSNDFAKPITTSSENFLQMIRTPIAQDVEIPQDEWVTKYLPTLRRSHYLLLEVPRITPDVSHTGQDEFIERLRKATARLQEIEKVLLEGEWDTVVKACRGVYEDLTKGISFNQTVKDLIRKDAGMPEKNLDDFVVLVTKSSDYDEAIHHARTSEGKEIKLIVHKEDAYFSFLRLLGLINMLSAKATRQVSST